MMTDMSNTYNSQPKKRLIITKTHTLRLLDEIRAVFQGELRTDAIDRIVQKQHTQMQLEGTLKETEYPVMVPR